MMASNPASSDARTFQIITEHDLEQLVQEAERIQLALPYGISAERGIARNVAAVASGLRHLSSWIGDSREWQTPTATSTIDGIIGLLRSALEQTDPERGAA